MQFPTGSRRSLVGMVSPGSQTTLLINDLDESVKSLRLTVWGSSGKHVVNTEPSKSVSVSELLPSTAKLQEIGAYIYDLTAVTQDGTRVVAKGKVQL